MSFVQVQSKYGISQKDFFAYLQIRHFVQANFGLTQGTMLPGPIEKFVLDLNVKKSVIKQSCANLQEYAGHHLGKLIDRWEEDLQCHYDETDWKDCIRFTHTLFLSNKYKEIQYKILRRQHRTPVFLNKIDSLRSSLCTKCKITDGTYLHCLWSCPKISKYWTCVTKEISAILKRRICKDPGQFLLGLPPSNKFADRKQFMLVNKLLFLARKCILFN